MDLLHIALIFGVVVALGLGAHIERKSWIANADRPYHIEKDGRLFKVERADE